MSNNQIFLNLLTNALKFTEKGSITLSYSLVSENEIENTIKIEIIDTGIGIDSKKIKKKKGRKARFLISKIINIIVQDRH